MSYLANALLVVTFVVAFHSNSAVAQQLQLFDSQEALDAKIAKHMQEGSFSALVAAVSPPSRTSLGRIKILEQELPEDFPALDQSVPIFRQETSDAVSREVTAWWYDETYIYLGLFLHKRDDGVAVLDFLLTGDIERATRWYLVADR